MWYVFGGKMAMDCKNNFWNILYLVWYLSWNSLMVSMRVLVQFWVWYRAVILEENNLRNFSILDLCHGVRVG